MWVLSVDAGSLLSVVKFDQKKAGAKKLAEKHKATDPSVDYMLVRSRIKASLGYVVEVLNALSENIEGYEPPIVESMPSADYKYRTIVSRDEWKRYLMFEVDGIDYDSHVKEETVKRQPEPRVANLYSALSATWSAWAKLQDTPPYGGLSYWSKPDCKNCGHTELKHSVKGDRCNEGWTWKGAKQTPTDKACRCDNYEPKPAPPAPPALPAGTKSAKDSASVFEQTYPSTVYGSSWDTESDTLTDAWDVSEDGSAHPSWCAYWDGDACICVEPELEEWEGTITVTHPAVEPAESEAAELATAGWYANGVWQEGAVKGETKRQRKARNERNRRRRRAAAKNVPAV